ncbi:hypothetical protein RGQ29_022667 [Quercus rubra]|uniref:Uncharacterized protein n=1 Tax=Quercus rubra TaxID=3512 RepID=A0AAN7IPM8_QUERU|nr:hypothetical protein RGQ29_022667 [Quercus rubra]
MEKDGPNKHFSPLSEEPNSLNVLREYDRFLLGASDPISSGERSELLPSLSPSISDVTLNPRLTLHLRSEACFGNWNPFISHNLYQSGSQKRKNSVYLSFSR